MTAFEDYARQLREEIRDGEIHLAHLRRMKGNRRGGEEQELVSQVQADVEYLRRELTTLHIWAEAVVRGVEIPEVEQPPQTGEVFARLRRLREGAAA